MEKLTMQSHDVIGSNTKKIAQLFPNCVTERLGKDGKPELAIDFEKLQAELSNEIIAEGEERYQFTWPDKRAAVRLANTPTTMTLRPCREESVDFDNTQNLYIEGDNLDVLKVLRETYLGKVKMIYIDPPYNTGNDFVYNDDFAQDKGEFEQASGLFDEEGNQTIDPMQRNTESNGRFHTDWLNMIYPRLKVARDLLADDGIIFLSIDNHEFSNIKVVCDEIYGGHNFISVLAVENNPKGRKNNAFIAESYEYCLIYAKNKSFIYDALSRVESKKFFRGVPNTEDTRKTLIDKYGEFKQSKRQVSGTGKSNAWARISNQDRCFTIYYMDGELEKMELLDEYDKSKDEWVVSPKGLALLQEGYTRYCCFNNVDMKPAIPLYSKATLRQLFNQHGLYFKDDGTIYEKDRDNTQQITSLLANKKFGLDLMTESATAKMEKLFGVKDIFTNTKAIDFIKAVINLYPAKNMIILDFFSGSATTAHAVMKLNAEDEGTRKFIMVQLPEKTEEKSEAYKAGYKNICEIGKERIRRAGKKVKEEARQQGRNLDTGFRVLKLDTSNMEDVYYTPQDFDLQTFFSENVKADRTSEDLLFQVMLDLGIELSAKIESKQIAGKEVHFVDDTYLVACFDTDVNETTIKEIAKLQPIYFVMRDASAANDNVIDNFEQIFKHYSPDTVCRII